MTSRGYVKTQFSWQYYYYSHPRGSRLPPEWLHLPAEIVPATRIKQQRSHAPPRGMMGEERGEREIRRPWPWWPATVATVVTGREAAERRDAGEGKDFVSILGPDVTQVVRGCTNQRPTAAVVDVLALAVAVMPPS